MIECLCFIKLRIFNKNFIGAALLRNDGFVEAAILDSLILNIDYNIIIHIM